MAPVPADPKLYHITHVDNLPSIVRDGVLWSDAAMVSRGGPAAAIGMTGIKQRRLALPVKCHPGDRVGSCVPFYFCPRSIMLFLICRGNHPELSYHGGQDPILHLEFDLAELIRWADAAPRRWAFTLANAGAVYTEFRSEASALAELNWPAIAARDFRDPAVKEGKQAEFLVQDSVPWALVRRIGVRSAAMQQRALRGLIGAAHRPVVETLPAWYF
jgi:hypothetical protein